jgi:NAD(P)-dependent dehydrogenase (short-subunit alcohol dehydrogenase family)
MSETDIHDLTGRAALITGASRGIGRAIAEELAGHGCAVALAARTPDAVQQAADAINQTGGRAIAFAADVTGEGAAERLVSETVAAFGRLDILVNNAGGNSFSVPVASMRLSGWSKTMTLNVESTVALIQQALPHLAQSEHGSIINVGSVAGLRGAPMMSHYGAAKAAIASLTRSVAIEAAYQGVRVNSLVPGWIDTDLTDFLRTDEGTEASVLSRVPMGRWGRSEEIAHAALFLASDASSFMTGQELVVDGGLSAMP